MQFIADGCNPSNSRGGTYNNFSNLFEISKLHHSENPSATESATLSGILPLSDTDEASLIAIISNWSEISRDNQFSILKMLDADPVASL
jgi:hypothetical protein